MAAEPNKWLERMLRRRSADAPAPAASGVCLDAETLAAWADGALNAKELAAAEIHASNCSRCMALLAALERTAPALPVESRSRGVWFRWLVPLTAAATAIAIWVAIPEQQVTPVAREEAPPSVLTLPPAPAQPTAPPPIEAPQSMLEGKQAPSARERAGNLSDSARSTPSEARKERDVTAGLTVTGERANAPQGQAAAPAPPASADAFSSKSSAVAERRAFNETVVVVIESVSPDDPQIRWRSPSGTDVERSIDGGQTWTKTASSPPGPIAVIRAVDALNATVTTSDSRTFSTTDGGATWAPVQEKPAAPF